MTHTKFLVLAGMGLVDFGLVVSVVMRLVRASTAKRQAAQRSKADRLSGKRWQPPHTYTNIETGLEADRALLGERLQETIEFLHHYNRESWAVWLEKSQNMIDQDPLTGIHHLRGAFGGIGSFNDIVIHPTNGDSVPDAEIGPVNDHLGWLQGELYQLSGKIQQELENAGQKQTERQDNL